MFIFPNSIIAVLVSSVCPTSLLLQVAHALDCISATNMMELKRMCKKVFLDIVFSLYQD